MAAMAQVLRVLASSSSFFISEDVPHREVIVEACYALSNLSNALSTFDLKSICSHPTWERNVARVLSNFELVLELSCKSFRHEDLRSKIIVALEVVKAFCRLRVISLAPRPIMLTNWDASGCQETVDGYQSHYRVHILRELPIQREQPSTSPSTPSTIPENSFRGRRSGILINHRSLLNAALLSRGIRANKNEPAPQHSDHSDAGNFATEEDRLPLEPVSPLNDKEEFQQCLVGNASAEGQLVRAELLYAARPALQALLPGRLLDSSAPLAVLSQRALVLFLCLAMEVLSINMTVKALQQLRGNACEMLTKHRRVSSSTPPHAFDSEVHRRQLAVFLCLLRSPLFDRATLPLLRSVERTLRPVPLFGALFGELMEALKYINGLHFYTSNS